MTEAPFIDKREKYLAELLERFQIVYRYAPELLVRKGDRAKKIQPHFHLPEYSTVIVFSRNTDYYYPKDEPRVTMLERLYTSNHFHFIAIPPERHWKPHTDHPTLLPEEYEEYVFKSIEDLLTGRLDEFRKRTGRGQ